MKFTRATHFNPLLLFPEPPLRTCLGPRPSVGGSQGFPAGHIHVTLSRVVFLRSLSRSPIQLMKPGPGILLSPLTLLPFTCPDPEPHPVPSAQSRIFFLLLPVMVFSVLWTNRSISPLFPHLSCNVLLRLSLLPCQGLWSPALTGEQGLPSAHKTISRVLCVTYRSTVNWNSLPALPDTPWGSVTHECLLVDR